VHCAFAAAAVTLGLPRHPPHERKTTIMKVALFLKKLGFNSTIMHSFGLASIGGALSLWAGSAARSDRDAKAKSQRLATFVGLWQPTFFLLGKVLQDLEATPDEQVEQARMKAAA
jgi:hypothetical protein